VSEKQIIRCEPINRNLNTLTCKHCGRSWYFEALYSDREKECPVAAVVYWRTCCLAAEAERDKWKEDYRVYRRYSQ